MACIDLQWYDVSRRERELVEELASLKFSSEEHSVSVDGKSSQCICLHLLQCICLLWYIVLCFYVVILADYLLEIRT